ncbi:MAG: S4 domain-containing protein, partial [Planctomycetota bacterium]
MRKTPKKTKKTKSSAPAGKQRLQKILAAAGIDSRRKCEILILEHAVSVNGEIVNELPAFADPEKDDIRVDGQRIKQTKKV